MKFIKVSKWNFSFPFFLFVFLVYTILWFFFFHFSKKYMNYILGIIKCSFWIIVLINTLKKLYTEPISIFELLFNFSSSCCSVAKLCPTLQPHGLQNAKLPYPALSSRVCSNLHPLSLWYYLSLSSSVSTFSFCLQSFPESGNVTLYQVAKVLEL